jgi:hypothetical protein
MRKEIYMVKINVDIKFSAHDAFLGKHSSGKLIIEKLESQINLKLSKQVSQKSAKVTYV